MNDRVVDKSRGNELQKVWERAWPDALALWSPFVKLRAPVWCTTRDQEKQERLSDSFAMIRLNDHSIVISLRQIQERGLQRFAKEVLAHEIGHHVFCPADLTDNARLLAYMRAGLPTKEHLAPLISNLYSDLLINDRLQRIAELDIAGVYLQLGGNCKDSLWTFYMRVYERLWRLPTRTLVQGELDDRIDQDAQLGARLIRSYAKDWLGGGGRFAALCLPYLMEDEAEKSRMVLAPLLDTRASGAGALPDGLAEIDSDELTGAIHPAEDPELSGVETSDEGASDMPGSTGISEQGSGTTGRKTAKNYRQPFEYAEVLRAAGVDLDNKDIVANYYRERAVPHLIPFPTRELPESTDPFPEGLDVWEMSSPIEQIDWLGTLLASPYVIPGVTTRERLSGISPGQTPNTLPIDLYLGVDCSGSMGNPGQTLSFPILAGAIIALSALRSGSRVKVVLSGEPGRSLSTDGFLGDRKTVMRTLTSYLGTGYAFGIHRLRETFATRKPTDRPVHILIVSDNDLFSMLDEEGDGRIGWDVAKAALNQAKAGGTIVLELPQHVRSANWAQNVPEYIARLRNDGWNVAIVASMDELVDFARKFARATYVRS